VNPDPAIVTMAPAATDGGEKDVSFGVTLKTLALSPDPPGVVTPTFPVFASAGTVARTCVAERTVGVAATPPKVTALAPRRFVPFTVTTVPTGPEPGVKVATVGTGPVTVKSEPLVATPPGVVTAIGPVVAPAGTVAVIFTAESTENVALVPWKVTAVAPFRFVPSIVTLVPAPPLVGVKSVIVGAGAPQLGNLNEPIRVFQPRSLVVAKYSFAYQNVQSSLGSTLMLE
jgi:hypothetical protein